MKRFFIIPVGVIKAIKPPFLTCIKLDVGLLVRKPLLRCKCPAHVIPRLGQVIQKFSRFQMIHARRQTQARLRVIYMNLTTMSPIMSLLFFTHFLFIHLLCLQKTSK